MFYTLAQMPQLTIKVINFGFVKWTIIKWRKFQTDTTTNSLGIYEAKLCNTEEAQDIRKFTYLKKCSLFTFINIIFKGKKKAHKIAVFCTKIL